MVQQRGDSLGCQNDDGEANENEIVDEIVGVACAAEQRRLTWD